MTRKQIEIISFVSGVDEQAAREGYLKAFEYAVKDGKATAIMSAFNYIGTAWAGASSMSFK